MLVRIDSGLAGAETFNTGLLDHEQFWFLSDMVMARGLHTGLALAADRLRIHVLEAVARQALVLRWCLLLASLLCLLGLSVWHYAVIDALRRSLMLVHASQYGPAFFFKEPSCPPVSITHRRVFRLSRCPSSRRSCCCLPSLASRP